MFKGIMAFEENAEDAVIVDQPAEGTAEGEGLEYVEAAEAPIVEMTEAEGEVTEVIDSIDTAVDVADTLEEVAENVETTIEEDGGLSEPAAQALEVAVEHLLTTVGFQKSKVSILATEGFGDKATRAGQTKLAVESIQEWAKKIWTAIENSFKRLVQLVKTFLGKVFDASKRLEARANALAAKAKGMKGKSAPNDAKINGASFGKVLHVGGELSYDVINKYVKETFAGIDKTQDEVFGYLEGVKGSIKSVLDKKGESAFQLTTSTTIGVAGGPKGFTAPEGTEVKHIELPFGDKALYFVLPTESRDGGSIGKATAFVADTGAGKAFEGGEVVPLIPEQVELTATVVAKTMAGVSKAKEALAEVEKFEKEILGAAKKLIAEDKELSDNAKTNINATAAATRGLVKLLSTSITETRSYQIKVGQALLNYGAASLKAVA